MARQKSYELDNTITGVDRLTGVNAESGATRNYTIDAIAEYFANTGDANPTRPGFNFTYGGVYDANNALEDGKIYVQFLSDAVAPLGFSDIIALYFKNESTDKQDFIPVRENLQGGIIKLANTSSPSSRDYGLFEVETASANSDNSTYLELNHLNSTGEPGLNKFSISPFGVGGSGGGGNDGDNILSGTQDPNNNVDGDAGDFFIRYRGDSAADRTPIAIYGPKFQSAGQVWGEGRNFTEIAASIELLPTITGAAGSNASVENEGDDVNAQFRFTIPRGDEGEQGPAGEDGQDGTDGEDGREITDITYDQGTNTLTFSFNRGANETVSGVGGVNGEDGATILSGTVDPVASDGNDGDYFFNTTSKVFFGPKVDGAWPATGTELDGEKGDDGDAVDNVRVVQAAASPGDNTIIRFQVDGTDIGNNITIAGGATGATGAAGADGTQVSANPSGTDGSDLNRISIDGTNYNIPSGGSSYTFQNNGTAVTNSSLIDTLNFSTNVTASQSGSTLTIVASGGGGGGSVVTATGSNGELTSITVDGTTYDVTHSNQVTANTGDSNDTELTSITIGDTSYSIPSGGGGGSTIQVNNTEVDDPNFITAAETGGTTFTELNGAVEVSVHSRTGNSSMALNGEVLTADGSGGVRWEEHDENVVANPGGSNNVALNSITIGNTNFDIRGVIEVNSTGVEGADFTDTTTIGDDLGITWTAANNGAITGIVDASNKQSNITDAASSLVASGRTYVTGLTLDSNGHITNIDTGTETDQDLSGKQDTISNAASSLTASSRTYVDSLTIDSQGHVTAIGTSSETVVDTNTTYDLTAVDSGDNAIIRLSDSGSNNDNVTIEAGSNITIDVSGNSITINSTGGGGGGNTPPTLVLTETGFDADQHDNVTQSITFNAAVTANDATIVSVAFSADGGEFTTVTDTDSPYTSGAQSISFDGDPTVVVTATVTYHFGDSSDTSTTDATLTLTLEKEDPVYSPSYAYSGFDVTPPASDNHFEAFDSGTVTVNGTLDTDDNNGWDIDGSPTYSPSLNSDDEFSVSSNDTDVTFTTSANWNETGTSTAHPDNPVTVESNTWERRRSLRLLASTDTVVSGSTEDTNEIAVQNLGNTDWSIQNGTIDPDGYHWSQIVAPGDSRLWIIYDTNEDDLNFFPYTKQTVSSIIV